MSWVSVTPAIERQPAAPGLPVDLVARRWSFAVGGRTARIGGAYVAPLRVDDHRTPTSTRIVDHVMVARLVALSMVVGAIGWRRLRQWKR